MKLLGLAVMSVLCALNQALTLSTVTTVTLALFSLNKPVSCFFGIFRRRSSPIQETVVSEPESPFNPFNQRLTAGFNPFTFGGGGAYPGFGVPGLGMFGFRFPARYPPPTPVRAPKPKREAQAETLPVMPGAPVPTRVQMPQNVPFDTASRDPRDDAPGLSFDETESFFTLIAETDENKCLSKFICEIGANPEAGGEFGKTIAEIIEGLKHFPDGSYTKVYNSIFYTGMIEGLDTCLIEYAKCDEESYQLVKTAQVGE